ncbi:hypothetical protein [Nocardia aurantia]|uniref:Roadblock/LAMTOR2 domain-containing protein n=1 Tax=Nocardia aurantia TaxID=2585199 RepID=A0A7K0DHW9_9NOCA|nr:hypothetical protein [Nocardia aurantia]MQY25403.1 hypothetical protein [Nocardia aurantia]
MGIDSCLDEIMAIPGARSVTLVDGASGLAVAAAGSHDPLDEHEDAAGTTDVVRAVLGCPALAVGDGGAELIVSGATRFHLLNLVDGDYAGRLFVHSVFDAEGGSNLAFARFRVRGILAELTGGGNG